jgi:hypothetical protein
VAAAEVLEILGLAGLAEMLNTEAAAAVVVVELQEEQAA